MIKDTNVDEPIKEFVRFQEDVDIDRYSDIGANGDLYFGTRKILNDRVALKFYFYNSHISSHQEPLLLKEVKHENILEIYDAKIINEQYAYFLTPEINGGDLQKFINTNIISTATAVSITQGILKGLSELHKNTNDFVHRDLKPNNILIDKYSLQPFIADFGSIKKIPEASESVVASKSTFIYKPYESIIDGEYYKQSDIYQVGVILFQLLGGSFPLAAADWLSDRQKNKLNKISGNFEQWQFIEECINQKIVKSKLLDFNTLPQYISKKLKGIIRIATNADKDKRYQTCAEFLKALFDYQKSAKDWWIDDDVIFANGKGKQTFKIYKDKKGYVLEVRKNGNAWRRDNKHTGRLKDIIEKLQ